MATKCMNSSISAVIMKIQVKTTKRCHFTFFGNYLGLIIRNYYQEEVRLWNNICVN